ncbi:MAG: class I SAM-dependent DNA methyltransferase [Hyphomonas sp.]
MTPQAFITKWRAVELKERTASQSHFIDLCHLLGLADPVTADPAGEWFTFEKGASKSGGGEGWADVWRKDCFAWEYKGKRKDLDAAFEQLRRYAIGLENPPLLIVSDMDTIRIHTNWTNTVQKVHVIPLDGLTDAANRDKLKACFENPESLKPEKTRQVLTEEAAAKFADIAERLRGRGHDGLAVAHFVQRLVFCMFAEDVNLLPNKMFQRMLEGCVGSPENFELHARTLFGAMKSGGMVGFEKVEWFNGGLFDDEAALPLEAADLKDLLVAAKLDWSDIDPSILGTLFERGLDPAKRSQLGAHYTDRDKIMQIVNPVIIAPLMAEWAGVKAAMEAALAKAGAAGAKSARTKAANEATRLFSGFMEKLAGFRVLDPACGSGNFLYLSLLALKDIEHRAQLEAEAMGLPRGFPRTGPENVLGIELNPYAAELARASVWIGEIQWMRRNGFEASRNPVLRSLNNIECRDAVLNTNGTRADWPKADVVVGNPPFLGTKRIVGELGEAYTSQLRKAYSHLPGAVDLVCYWFAIAWSQIESGQLFRAGFVATNSVRVGASRSVLVTIVERGRVFESWSDEEWVVEGAAVRVSLICFDGARLKSARADGEQVEVISSTLSGRATDTARAETLQQNRDVAFIGIQKNGPFDVVEDKAHEWLASPINPNGQYNSVVLKRLVSGRDLVERDRRRWIVDFYGKQENEAMLFEQPYRHVAEFVKPERLTNNRDIRRRNWWLFGEVMPRMRASALRSPRFIATSLTSKYRVFVWREPTTLCDSTCVVIAKDDFTFFGLLHSAFHSLWSLQLGNFMGVGNDPRYTPSTTFETFPFPEGLTPNIPAADYAADPRAQKIAAAAARLNELRENWLNPADLVVRVPEVVPGYPDRILPKDAAAEAVLKKRTLTNLYNERPAWLDHAHAALDEAVAEAYGWGEDWRAGKLTEDEILARLFRLNQERAAAQAG